MIGIIYDESNKELMENELSSLNFQRIEDIELVNQKDLNSNYAFLITDDSMNCILFPSIKFVLIVYDVDQEIVVCENIVMVQYESEYIKYHIERKYHVLKLLNNVVINRIPKQKLEIKPLDTQDATIFFHGIDSSDNMIDEMFELDRKVYYDVKFYNSDTKEIPSKKHRLSWNVTINDNNNGFISWKILKEIENGCLPILIKEKAPRSFFAYPFFVTLKDLRDEDKLINAIKDISSFISKMTRAEFKELANAMYNNIYVSSRWNYSFYRIAEEIAIHLENN